MEKNNTLVLIIDIQEKLLNAVYNKDVLERKSEIIAKASKILDLPVLLTEQYPQGLGKTINNILDNLPNSAKIFEKVDFSALNSSSLLEELIKANYKEVVLFGIETHICVYQTALALLEKGFKVVLVKDASGSRSEFEHNTAIEDLRSQGCRILSTEMILFELLKSAKHPKFKEIQALIK